GADEGALLPLYDPQTSGGLLVSAPPEEAERYVRALRERGETAEVVGDVVEEPGILVTS
ncbi:MAG: AIR synthase-related protein, partial [Actinomycetota bacterium]|nr:AIR synthase-related protein [Actinomycetota bacterium]